MSMYDFKAIQDSTIESKLMASQKLMPRQHHLANHRPPPPSMPCVPAHRQHLSRIWWSCSAWHVATDN